MVSARTIGKTEKAMNADMDTFQIAHAVPHLLLEDAVAQTDKDCLVLTFVKGKTTQCTGASILAPHIDDSTPRPCWH